MHADTSDPADRRPAPPVLAAAVQGDSVIVLDPARARFAALERAAGRSIDAGLECYRLQHEPGQSAERAVDLLADALRELVAMSRSPNARVEITPEVAGWRGVA